MADVDAGLLNYPPRVYGTGGPVAYDVDAGYFPLVAIDPASPPGVTVVSPAPNTQLTPQTPIVVDVADEQGVRVLDITIRQPDGRLVAFTEGRFESPFIGTRQPIENGYRVSVRRQGGWRYPITVYVRAIDTRGSEA